MEAQRDVFQFRDIRRLASHLGYCLVQMRGRFVLLSDCENGVAINEFLDLESVEAWLISTRFSPCLS